MNSAEDGEFVLGDVKTIGFGRTRYWNRSPASMRAVDSRAASVNTDMRSRLRTIDREILGRSPNGPLELRLSAVGPIRGLVFSEISEEARKLLCYAADATAARTWVEDSATSQDQLQRGVGEGVRICPHTHTTHLVYPLCSLQVRRLGKEVLAH